MQIKKYNMGGQSPKYLVGGQVPQYNMGGQMQGQMQRESQGGSSPEVSMLLEMLDSFGIPDEVTVGEIKEKMLNNSGESVGMNIPPSPMQMQ